MDEGVAEQTQEEAEGLGVELNEGGEGVGARVRMRLVPLRSARFGGGHAGRGDVCPLRGR